MATANAQEKPGDQLSLLGDLRGGYYGAHRDGRDSSEDTTHQLLGRLRVGALWAPTETLSLKARVAGRYSSRNNDYHAKFFTHIPDADGLLPGQATVDELFVSVKPSEKWEVDVGRLQTAFELEGVSAGSLDRSDSPNVDISWTDGAHLRYKANGGWNAHLILQRNLAPGPTNVRLPPLEFRDRGSRLSYFAALENKEPLGPMVQRGLDLTYLPKSLDADGDPSSPAEDYVAVVGRLAAQWFRQTTGLKLLLGAELGYAANAPARSAVGTGSSGEAGAIAWQAQVSFLDVLPDHSFALQHGQADAGWLISPDFRSNEILSEARYEWKISQRQAFTTRYRLREEKDRLTGATEKRRDQDVFLRYTLKF
jgi:hypothetical protein